MNKRVFWFKKLNPIAFIYKYFLRNFPILLAGGLLVAPDTPISKLVWRLAGRL